MAGPLVNIQVDDTDLLLRLDAVPRRIRAALRTKFEFIIDNIQTEFFKHTPGKFLDPSMNTMGIEEVSPTQIAGYVELNQKTGTYTITAKGRALRFIGARDGEVVMRKYVAHPYPKVTRDLARQLIQLKPWIEDQLYDAVIEAL
jgi:hypothetical protein